jgi:ubiquinone/menaquinone biosynthesis C-methylase UbiE
LRNDLIFTFSEAYRVLKKNGKMIIGTPNVRSLKGLFKYLVKGINYSTVDSLYQEWFKLGQYGHMGHVREYTHKEIETFMENIGFTPIKVIYKKSPKIKSINTNIITYIKPSLKSYMSLIFIKK